MKRFFLAGPVQETMTITGDDAHHIGFSLRMAVGDLLGITGTDGRCAIGAITKIAPGEVTLILRELTESTEATVNVWLAQALPKADKLEWVIQKAVELGVQRIIPVQTQHCVVHYAEAKQAEKGRRWQKIAREAAMQSGRSRVPDVNPIVSLPALMQSMPENARVVVLYEGQNAQALRSVLSRQPRQNGTLWVVIIGPEGGFSNEEILFLQSRGVIAAGLGPRILKADTATIAALSVLFYECGDLGGT